MSATPGPWRLENGTTLIWGNCDPNDASSYGMGYPIASVAHRRAWNRNNPTEEEIVGNCALIAAAPDLLLAVKCLCEEMADYMAINKLGDPNDKHNYRLGMAAIAKAEATS